MKCFYIFKDKFKPKKGSNSAPEPRNQNRLDNNSALNRTARSLPSPRSIPELYKEKEHHLRVFDMQELREATNGFNRMLKIGEGGFGSVYKGTIRPLDGRGEPLVVAVKKLNNHGLQVQGHNFSITAILFFLNCYSDVAFFGLASAVVNLCFPGRISLIFIKRLIL